MKSSMNMTHIKSYILRKIGLDQCSSPIKLPFLAKAVTDLVIITLKIFSVIYGLIIEVRNFFYNIGICTPSKLKCKVLSIGNITLGGTGKTPAVISLGKYLIDSGKKVCILLRGYKGGLEQRTFVVSDSIRLLINVADAGDEAVMIAKSLSQACVLIGKDRIKSGKLAIKKFSPDVIILDDAYQHRSIHRDVDILILDSEKPFGNGWVLPAGNLREPKKNIKRANVVIYSRSNKKTTTLNLNHTYLIHSKKISYSEHVPKEIIQYPGNKPLPIEDVDNMQFLAFSGIGRPDSFEESLRTLNIKFADHLVFDDHHDYSKDSYEIISNRANELKISNLITTEKDIVKIDSRKLANLNLYFLRIEFAFIKGYPSWKELIDER
jgi:tetraacyldisaccharide 4'-kinase